MTRILVCLLSAIFLSPCLGVELVGEPIIETTSSNAVVHWQTDVSAGTKIQLTPNVGKTIIPDKRPDTTHTATIGGLEPGMKYSVAVGTARAWLHTNTFTTTGAARIEKTEKKTKPVTAIPKKVELNAPPTRKTWGNLYSLADHFERHGSDFKAKDEDDYARQAWEFLQRAKAEGLPAKSDDDGSLRVFDPKTRTFASYNSDGTTKTYFKPESRDYFDRQPGNPINLKTAR